MSMRYLMPRCQIMEPSWEAVPVRQLVDCRAAPVKTYPTPGVMAVAAAVAIMMLRRRAQLRIRRLYRPPC